MQPTAVGLLDLDLGLVPTLPRGEEQGVACRDTLLLVRLHGEPLGFVYVDCPPDELSDTTLAESVWSRVGNTIRAHAAESRCTPPPASADEIIRLSAAAAGRPGEAAEHPGGHGACRLDVAALPPGRVAVIVPTTGRSRRLGRCLASLRDLPGVDYEVIVVDNRPGHGDTKAVVDEASTMTSHGLSYVAEPKPGSAAARNRGLLQTDAEILAFTDDDVVADPGWLRWLVEPFTSEGVGATTGLVMPLELDTPAQKLFELYSGFSLGLARRSYDLATNRADDRLLYPFWGGMFGSGASMAFRRAGLVAGGGFDAALTTGQDIAALSAAVLRGERLVYEPRSLTWHANHRDEAALRRQLFNYGAGFTAVLTRALVHDRRFGAAVARSVPVALRLYKRRRSQAQGSDPTLPRSLARLEKLGMVWGPARYATSVARSRRSRAHGVVGGR